MLSILQLLILLGGYYFLTGRVFSSSLVKRYKFTGRRPHISLKMLQVFLYLVWFLLIHHSYWWQFFFLFSLSYTIHTNQFPIPPFLFLSPHVPLLPQIHSSAFSLQKRAGLSEIVNEHGMTTYDKNKHKHIKVGPGNPEGRKGS